MAPVDNGASVATRATATVAAAAAGPLAVLRLVNLEGAAIEVLSVQRLHGAGCIGVRHFHETEAARTAGVAIRDQRDLLDRAVLREQGTYGLFGRREGEISNV